MIVEFTLDRKKYLWESAKKLADYKKEYSAKKFMWDGRDPRLRYYMGFLGEDAVAQVLGIPYEVEFYDRYKGDGGCDLSYKGHKVGVKTSTFHPKPTLAVKVDEKKADVYYLVELFQDTGKVDVVGWMRVENIVNREPRKLHKKGPLNYLVPYEELVKPWQ